MKRFTLLFMLMSLMIVSFGQVVPKTRPDIDKQESTDYLNVNQQKVGGDIIWQTTFNWKDTTEARGWKLPDGWTVKDISDRGFYWIWRQDSIGGRYSRGVKSPEWFQSRDDGFIVLPMDWYNTLNYDRNDPTGLTEYASDSWIQTEKIDCSKASSVIVKFNQYFRLCCASWEAYHYLQMFVTTDNVHWSIPFDCNKNSAFGLFTDPRFRSVEFNISDIAAGSKTVQIRFYMNGASHYFWAIDDLKLVEAFQNEVVLEDTWLDFDGGADATVGHINNWPLSQMNLPGTTSGTVGNYFFKGAVVNNGTEYAENTKLEMKILKNGTQVYSDLSPGKTLEPQQRDTQKITNPYLANDYGDYVFEYNTVFKNPDEVPANNKAKKYFTVNDTLLLRSDFTAEASYFTDKWVNGGASGEMVGISYDLYKPAEINYMTAYLAGFEADKSPQFQFVLMKADPDVDYVELIATEVIDMDSSYMNSWVTLPVVKDGETEFLPAGNYAAMVRVMGTDPNTGAGVLGIDVGQDLSTRATHDLAFFLGTDGGWGGEWDMMPMVGFSIKATGGPTKAPATFNVDMTKHIASGEFKPGTDFVDVAGTFNNWSGSAHLTDPESDGIYTITLPDMPVGDTIQYKYRINANWSTSEYPNGGPNRKYKVRYWNVLNNVYNGGITTGVDQTSLVASFSVYPNPTRGTFNVAVTNVVASDLVITLTNIQGQVIYRNTVSKVVNYQETIDNKLSKGLYFLTVNNGKEVKVQKVIVQ